MFKSISLFVPQFPHNIKNLDLVIMTVNSLHVCNLHNHPLWKLFLLPHHFVDEETEAQKEVSLARSLVEVHCQIQGCCPSPNPGRGGFQKLARSVGSPASLGSRRPRQALEIQGKRHEAVPFLVERNLAVLAFWGGSKDSAAVL